MKYLKSQKVPRPQTEMKVSSQENSLSFKIAKMLRYQKSVWNYSVN